MTQFAESFTEAIAECHRLIDLAYFLKPEGEGMDLSDEDYDIEDIAHLKAILGNMRSSIDMVSHALAIEWNEQEPGSKYQVGDIVYSVGHNTKKVWAHNDKGMAFAEWVLEQNDPELLAALIPPSSVRVTPLNSRGVTETFIVKEQTNDTLTIKSRRIE